MQSASVSAAVIEKALSLPGSRIPTRRSFHIGNVDEFRRRQVLSHRTRGRYNRSALRAVCWLLIGLAALAFAVGTTIAFTQRVFLLPPVGYWRGAVGFLLFAIALRLMERRA